MSVSLTMSRLAFACLALALSSLHSTAAEEKPAATSEGKPIAVVGSWDDVQKRVAASKGKVTVVNIWTTTCGTCREEFPGFVALRKLAGPEKLTLIAVACDYDGIAGKPPEFYRERVDGFLRDSKATAIDNVLLNRAFVDFLDDIELKSTPAFYVYGPDGRLVRRFDNDKAASAKDEFHADDVRKQVESLLGPARAADK